MTQRLLDNMKLLWCLLIIYSGPVWNPVRCVTVRNPPKNPSTIEAQAKFFQDFFSVQLSPYKIEFGHVCEDPNTWEQRYEKKDFKNHRDMGKVRWGDKKGGYGEHYWDLNHAGHAANHGNDGYSDDGSYHEDDGSYHEDDGSYHEDNGDDSYNEPSQQAPSYQTDEYDPETASKYDENNRAKRAHTKTKGKKQENNKNHRLTSQKPSNEYEQLSDEETVDEYVAEASDEKETFQKIPEQKESKHEAEKKEERSKTKNQIVLVVNKKERENKDTSDRYVPHQVEPKFVVPYEGGAGIRQHQHPEITAASASRLFLEPSTGRVIDRTTGQAYVLQPLVQKTNYS